MTTPATTEARHASWLELFFDLVIVAAVAQLAHLLHDAPRPFDVFLFAVLYYAIWSVWTAFTLYANVAGDRTRRRAMLAAMFGIAVMAASIPKVAEGNPGSFVGAYIVCRVLAAGSWKRSSRVMTEWPAVQQAIGLIPWIVSVGFGPPMRYVLWTAGVGLDVLLSVWRSREPRRVLELEQRQRERERRTWMRRIARNARWQRRMPELPDVQPAEPNRPYLGERLGLFVIIVLGEAVAQVVNAAAAVTVWHRDLWLVVLAGFGLLVCLWWLTLQYGPTAAPEYGVRVFNLNITLPAQFVTTGSIVAIAAGLGAMAGHLQGNFPAANRWVLCAGAAAYFLTATVMGGHGGAPRRWVLGWGLPAVSVCVLLGSLGGPLPAWALAAVIAAVALWLAAYRRFDPGYRPAGLARRARRSPTGDAP